MKNKRRTKAAAAKRQCVAAKMKMAMAKSEKYQA